MLNLLDKYFKVAISPMLYEIRVKGLERSGKREFMSNEIETVKM